MTLFKHAITILVASVLFSSLLSAQPGISKYSDISEPLAGEPDESGYRWFSSETHADFSFNWINISDEGDAVTFTSGLSAPVELPFESPVFGELQNRIRIYDDGSVGFGPKGPDATNTDPESVYSILAPLGEFVSVNLDRVHTYFDENRQVFVIQYNGVMSASSSETAFGLQVLLFADGRVLVQYENFEMEGLAPAFYRSDGSLGMRIVMDDLSSTRFALGITPADEWKPLALGRPDFKTDTRLDQGTVELVTLPFFDDFPVPGGSFPNWITADGEVNATGGSAIPSPPFTLNLNADPTGGDNVTLETTNLAGQQGAGLVFVYSFKPGDDTNGENPDLGEFLFLEFRNNLGAWVEVRSYEGYGFGGPPPQYQSFQRDVVNIAAEPAGGGTFFHAGFQARFRSNGSTGPFDDWFVDDVFIGAPANLSVTPGSIVDTLILGNTSDRFFKITNNDGTVGALNYTVVDPNEAWLLPPLPQSGSLLPLQSEQINFTLNANVAPGTYNTEIAVNGTPGNQSDTVFVTLVVKDRPIIRVEPDTVFVNLSPDLIDTSAFTIHNDGGGALTVFSIQNEEISGSLSPSAYLAVLDQNGNLIEAADGTDNPFLGIGGPDLFGYRWIDSDEPGGPIYSFNDISQTGTPLALTASPGSPSALNEGYAVVNLPFNIKFYDQVLDQVVIHSNGFVVLDGTWRPSGGSAELPPNSLPGVALPNALVAPLWNDLDGAPNSGQILTKTIGEQFIIQYDNWSNRTATGDTLTFQMIFFKESRTVLFQYAEFQNSFENYIVGSENFSGNDGLLVAPKFSNYLHEGLTVQISKEALWLSENPGSAVIPPGGSLDFDLIFDTDGLAFGTYEASLIIFNNDPFNGIVKIPNIVMLITAPPDITLSETTLSFGTVFINETGTDTVTVTNDGGAILTVGSVTSDNPDFVPNPSGFSLNIGESRDVIVTLTPSGPGVAAGTLTFNSNDPDESSVAVALTANVSDLPNLTVNPAFVQERFKIGTGSSNSQLIALTNSGGDTVSFSFPDFAVIDGTGGTDGFGHRWINSDQPGGPVFEWFDVAALGTSVTLGNNDFVAVPLPFTFSFFGQPQDTVLISSNGYLTFGSSGTVSLNTNLPNSNQPNDLIAPFWDDLNPSAGGSVHHYYDPSRNRFIVQFTNVPHINGSIGGPYTFQAILGIDESITFQYLDVTINSPSNTVGIENQSGTDGLQVAHNTAYVHDSLAVLISENNNGVWLGITPVSGTLPSGASSNVEVSFSDPGLTGGLYRASLLVNSNDPDEPQRGIPVTLQINRPTVRDNVTADLVIAEDDGSVIAARLDSIFSDIDLDPLSYTLQVTGASVTALTSNDTLLITTLQDAFGSNVIIVTADDGQYTVSDTFTVTVNPVNDAPVLALPDFVFAEDDSLNAGLNTFVTDVDHDTTEITFGSTVLSAALESFSDGLSVTAEKIGAGPVAVNSSLNETGDLVIEVGNGDLVITIDNLSNRATFKTSADSFGVFKVEFTAADDSGAVARDTINVTVLPVNDPPFRIGSVPDQSYAEDSGNHLVVADLNTVFDDIDNPVLTFGTTVSDDGLIASAADGILEVTTASDAFGIFTIIVSASDSQFTVRDTFEVVITPVNDSPTVSSEIPDLVIGEDFGSLVIADLDTVFLEIDPGDQLVYTAFDQNGLLSVDVAGSVLTLNSVVDMIGLESVVVSATDDSGAVVRDTFFVDIRNLNDGPTVLNPLPDLVLAEDFSGFVAANLDTVFNDVDPGDNLAFSIAAINGRLVAQLNGSDLELSSIADVIGDETIIVTATDDSGATVNDTLQVSVFNLNDAPVVVQPINDLVLPEDFTTFDHVDLTSVFQDIDPGDNLSFSVSLTNGILTAAVVGGNLRLSSIADQIGSETVIVIATDDSAAAVADTFEVTIVNLNDAPVVDSPMPDVTLDEDFGSFVVADLDTVFNDIDPGDQLSFTAVASNGVLSAGVVGGFLNLTSIQDANGLETIVVTATDDSGASVSDTLVVDLTPLNDAPVAGSIADVTLGEDFGLVTVADLDTVFSDVDLGDQLTFGVSTKNGLLTPSAAGTFLNLSSLPDLFGTDSVFVTATDDSGASVVTGFRVTINNLNDAPVVLSALPDAVLDEDFAGFDFADLDTVFNDIDPGDNLSYAVQFLNGLAAGGVSGSTLNLSSLANAQGIEMVVVTATDDSGAAVADTFQITINNLNDAPMVIAAIDDITLAEDFGTITVASLASVFADIDPGDGLAYGVTAQNGLLVPSIMSGDLRLSSLADVVGTETVFVTATDDSGAVAADTFFVTIENLNDTPMIVSAIQDGSVPEDFGTFVYVDLDTVFADIDPGDNLFFSGTTELGVFMVTVDGSGLRLTSSPDAIGTETVIVTATDDSGAAVSDTFVVIVNNINDAPFVNSPIPDTSIAEDFQAFPVVDLTAVFSDVDPGDNAGYTVSSAGGVLLAMVAGSDLVLSSLADAFGVETVIVTATDDSGAAVSDTFVVTVDPVNDPPTVSNPISDQTIPEEAENYFVADLSTVFSDVEGNITLFSVTSGGGVAGAVINDSLLIWGSLDFVGFDTVTVSAVDDSGALVSDQFVVTVTNLNDAPTVVQPVSDLAIPEDKQDVFVAALNFVFGDVDDNLSFFSVNSNGNVLGNINITNDSLFISATLNFLGFDTLTVTATDDSGASASDVFVVEVTNLNFAPIVQNPIPDLMIPEDSDDYVVADLSAVFFDIDDGDSLRFVVSSQDGNVVGNILNDTLFLDAVTDFVGFDFLIVAATDDSGAVVADSFDVEVENVNDSPVVVAPISDVLLDEDFATTSVAALDTVFADIDPQDSLSFTVQVLGSIVTASLQGTQLLLDPIENANGSVIVVVTAEDLALAVAADSFAVLINNVNDGPVLSGIPDVSFDEDNMTSVFLNPFVSDVDNDTTEIRFSAEIIDAAEIPNSIPTTQKVIRVKKVGAKKSAGLTAPKKIRSGLDEEPAVSSKAMEKVVPKMPEPKSSRVEVPAGSLFDGHDGSVVTTGRLVGSDLFYTAGVLGRERILEIGLGDLLISIDTVTNVANFSTTLDSSGTFTVVFEATDPDGLSDTDTIWVVVLPVNDAPVVGSPIDDIVLDEDFGSSFVADLTNVFHDVESDVLSFSATVSGPGVGAQIAGDSLFLVSGADFNGNLVLLVTATDNGGLSVSDTAHITILPVNDSPLPFALILPANGDTLVSLTEPVVFSWQSSSDVDGDTLIYSLVISNAGIDTIVGGLADTTMALDPQFLTPGTVYEWSVFVSDGTDLIASPDTFEFVTPDSIVGIGGELTGIPEQFALHHNYPNPFNPSTVIRYDLPTDSRVILKVYNLMGQEVRTLVNGFEKAGYRSVVWDGRNRYGRQVASGLYIYRIQTSAFVRTLKMMLVR